MNPHQEPQIKNLQKVVICSHDRLQESDDTSNFSVELSRQIEDVSQFKLVACQCPLSSYTFNKDDDDRTFEITTAEKAARFRNTATIPAYYLNFAYYTRPFNSGAGYGSFSASEILRVRNDGLFIQSMDAGLPGVSIALRIFNSVSEANSASYQILYNQNSTVNYVTIAQNLQNHCAATGSLPGYDLSGLRFRDNWQSPNNENADAQNEYGSQTVFSHPDASDDPGRDVIYFYNKKANQDFTVSIGWFYFNSATTKYDIPVQGGSVFVNMNSISTKTSIGTYLYGIRPPSEGGWSNYKTKLIGFFNTIYTNTSLVAYLNSQMTDYGISWSKVQNGDIVGLDKLVLNAPTPNTGYRRIDAVNGDVICFRRLGYRYSTLNPALVLRNAGFIGPFENLVSDYQPLENMNIYYEIKTANIQINPAVAPNIPPEVGISTGTHLLSDLIQQLAFQIPNPLDFASQNILLELVNDPNAINPGYYSLKMSSPATSCRRLELRIDDKLRQIYIPTEPEYNYKLAAGEPYSTSTVAQGLLFQPYFSPPLSQTLIEKNIWFPNPLPITVTASYSIDTMYTEAQLLADTQVITTSVPNLLFSIVEHKLKIINTSESIGYIIRANERLGIPVDAGLSPLSTYTAIELIDISSLNDVIYVSLPDLYQDGKNSYNSFKNLTSDPTHQRPSISSIVCSIANNADVQYGKYVSYRNDSDSWMRCISKDLKTFRVVILDSEYRIMDLNRKAVHLELDFR